jgi:hypothetical protein
MKSASLGKKVLQSSEVHFRFANPPRRALTTAADPKPVMTMSEVPFFRVRQRPGLQIVYVRPRWQSDGVPQAEQSASAKGHLTDRIFVSIYVSSLHR